MARHIEVNYLPKCRWEKIIPERRPQYIRVHTHDTGHLIELPNQTPPSVYHRCRLKFTRNPFQLAAHKNGVGDVRALVTSSPFGEVTRRVHNVLKWRSLNPMGRNESVPWAGRDKIHAHPHLATAVFDGLLGRWTWLRVSQCTPLCASRDGESSRRRENGESARA